MKLFALPDGTIDRKDRAQWLTMPFDLAFRAGVIVAGPYTVVVCQVFSPGAEAAEVFSPGTVAGEVFRPGAVVGDVG